MLTLRYIFRLTVAFLTRFRMLLAAGVLLGIIAFFSLRFLGPYLISGKTERIGQTGRYQSNNLPDSILSLIGDGLTKVEKDGSVVPGLASSWETPDGGKTWIFHLADNRLWQDGKEVTSDDIVYEFSDVAIDRPGDQTIIFKLQNPYSPFPSVVGRPTFKKGLLGTGQWKVTKVTVSGNFVQELVLVNEKRDKKIIKFYPTEERTKLAFMLGQVDVLEGIFDPSPFESWKTLNVTGEANLNQFVAVFFNTQDEFLSEKSLRQALNYSVNKEVFEGERALGPISPLSWANNPQVKPYTYEVERTRELINDIPSEVKDKLTIKLVTTPVLLSTAERIAEFWRAIGVKTEVQVSSGLPDQYQSLLAIFDIPKDPDQYSIWHSTQTSTNISKYQNPRIDKLLEDGRNELDFEERRKIYLDFQRFLVEDAPAAFLYHPISYTVVRK